MAITRREVNTTVWECGYGHEHATKRKAELCAQRTKEAKRQRIIEQNSKKLGYVDAWTARDILRLCGIRISAAGAGALATNDALRYVRWKNPKRGRKWINARDVIAAGKGLLEAGITEVPNNGKMLDRCVDVARRAAAKRAVRWGEDIEEFPGITTEDVLLPMEPVNLFE